MIFKAFSFCFKVVLYGSVAVVFALVLDIYLNPLKTGEFPDEDIDLEIGQLINKYGYPFERHAVTTKDGYILEIHRIPHGRTSNSSSNRHPIILMHGLVGSSIQFIISGEKTSLAYYLADRGYDVWMPNARGNHYSRNHQQLNADNDKAKFFDFSWNEIGSYDIPATIDHVLKVTGQKKIYYSGHSQGSVAFFAMLSERPEYNDKVKGMIALAPVVYTKHVIAPAFTITATFQGTAEWLSELLNVHEFLPKSNFVKQFASKLCWVGSPVQDVCTAIIWLSGGFNQEQYDKAIFPLHFSHVPAGAALKQLFHYTQILNSELFQKYDHGTEMNLEKYGQTTPPLYKFENMKVPVAIFYGANDWLTLPNDIEKLHKNLPNVILLHKVADKNFAHFDFLGCKNVVEVLHRHFIDVLDKF